MAGAPSHREGLLLLSAAGALALVALAGTTLLRMLVRLGRLSPQGPVA